MARIHAFLPAAAEPRTAWAQPAEIRMEVLQSSLNRLLTEDLRLRVLRVEFAPLSIGWTAWLGSGVESSLRRLDGPIPVLVRTVNGADYLDASQVRAGTLSAVLSCAQLHYDMLLVDLSEASPSMVEQVASMADAVFVLSDSTLASLELARDKAAWLRRRSPEEECGLLLQQMEEGVPLHEAEEMAGLPVCGLVNTLEDVETLALWLAEAPARAALAFAS